MSVTNLVSSGHHIVCVRACPRAYVPACVCACVRACVRACARVCVCVCARARARTRVRARVCFLKSISSVGFASISEQDPQHLQDGGAGRVQVLVFAGDGHGPEVQEPDPVVQVPELLLQDLEEPGPELVSELRVAFAAVVHHVRATEKDLGFGVCLQELGNCTLG